MPRENFNEINALQAQGENCTSAFTDKKSMHMTKPNEGADLPRPQRQTSPKNAHGKARLARRWLPGFTGLQAYRPRRDQEGRGRGNTRHSSTLLNSRLQPLQR